MILDAGVLISVDRGDQAARALLEAVRRTGTALHTTAPIVAQVWRDGSTQVRLGRFLEAVLVHPLDEGKPIGRALHLSHTSDVVDAHLVIIAAQLRVPILTGDVGDIAQITSSMGALAPVVHEWPPS